MPILYAFLPFKAQQRGSQDFQSIWFKVIVIFPFSYRNDPRTGKAIKEQNGLCRALWSTKRSQTLFLLHHRS